MIYWDYLASSQSLSLDSTIITTSPFLAKDFSLSNRPPYQSQLRDVKIRGYIILTEKCMVDVTMRQWTAGKLRSNSV